MAEERTELRHAAEKLSEASDTASDAETGDRLERYVEQAEEMAAGDHGPDHGRLARFEHNLRDVEGDLDAEGTDLVDAALSHVKNYRETVEGV